MQVSIFVGEKNGRRWYAVKVDDLYVSFDQAVVLRLCQRCRVFLDDLDLGDNVLS